MSEGSDGIHAKELHTLKRGHIRDKGGSDGGSQ